MSSNSGQILRQTVEDRYGEVLRLVRAKAGCGEVAKDILQETWLRAAAYNGQLPDDPAAYIRRMAANLTHDHFRKTRATDRTTKAFEVIHGTALAAGSLPDIRSDDVLIARQELSLLVTALRKMPATRRTAFLFCRVDGMTMREAGQALGLSERTVEKHVARALLDCRQALKPKSP